MLACIAAVLGFHSSSNLAAAYGVAITMTMVITTLLFYVLVRDRWNWSLPVALAGCGFFCSSTWRSWAPISRRSDRAVGFRWWCRRGIPAHVDLATRPTSRGPAHARESDPLELFLAELLSNPPIRVPGVSVFLSSNPVGTPPALRHNVAHNRCCTNWS